MRFPMLSLAAGAAAAAGVVYAAGAQARPVFRFDGRVVLITGSSRGFGLVLARALTRRGATVVLLARDGEALQRAAATVASAEPVQVIRADVRDAAECRRAVIEVINRHGRLDMLVNNAGAILSAPFVHTTTDDFRDLMAVHFWGTLHMTQAALPYLRVRPGARIVNIGSIGGRIAVPHLSAYSASKFAQVGLSSALGHELRAQGITVCTVAPGLMRTGSHMQARFRGDAEREFAVFTLAATLPGVSMAAERAADSLLRAVARGQADIVLPFAVRQVARGAALAPNLAARALALINRLLPDGRWHGFGHEPAVAPRGLDLHLPAAVRVAATLGERAASRNNERPASSTTVTSAPRPDA